jgi:hypothetical protein
MDTGKFSKMGAKRLQPGEIFLTQTKILSYQRKRPYKKGTEKYFQKGKRRYLCKVVCLVEVACGFHVTAFSFLKNAQIPSQVQDIGDISI